ncbi:MAG: helix-turn-helix domain-containing protein [Akkermansiaceae bacterium]|nr:helix-turn-helix domain-containing protein [Akkermansiaceae bacterium]
MGDQSTLQIYEQRIFNRLAESDLYKTYQNAFRNATGLPLRLVGVDEQWRLPEHLENQSPFCEKLNLCDSACQACVAINRKLMDDAKAKGPSSCSCFSGMSATAVPITLGSNPVAFLKTGQVFQRTPDENDFNGVLKTLTESGFVPDDVNTLKEAYFQTRTVSPERYQSMVTLLSSFGEQLSRHADDLATAQDGREPEAIAKARKFIHAHLGEALPLPVVSRHAGLSESHFCRVFKEVAGLTLTEYISRCRIAWTKRELLRPAARISDVAFKVGFQSLSQFNRSFARLTGCSPSAYRTERIEKAAS